MWISLVSEHSSRRQSLLPPNEEEYFWQLLLKVLIRRMVCSLSSLSVVMVSLCSHFNCRFNLYECKIWSSQSVEMGPVSAVLCLAALYPCWSSAHDCCQKGLSFSLQWLYLAFCSWFATAHARVSIHMYNVHRQILAIHYWSLYLHMYLSICSQHNCCEQMLLLQQLHLLAVG